MTVQTSYEQTPVIGFNGMLAQQFSLRQVDSGLVENGPIMLGAGVKRGTTDNQYVASAPNELVEGIAIYSHHQENPGGDFEYMDKAAIPVLTRGRYYAVANGAIAIADIVAYDPATGKVGARGPGTTTLEFGLAVTTAAADGDLVIVEIQTIF